MVETEWEPPRRTSCPATYFLSWTAGSAAGLRTMIGEAGFGADEVYRRVECLIGVHRRGVKQKCVGSRLERGHRSLAVARISFLHVLQDGCIYYRDAAFLQLFQAPLGSCFNRSGDKKFGVGVGADDRAGIAAIKDGAARTAGRVSSEIALECQQRFTHRWDDSDLGGRGGDFIGAERRVRQHAGRGFRVQGVGGFGGLTRVGWVAARS